MAIVVNKVEAWSYNEKGEDKGLIVFYPTVGHYVIWNISRMVGQVIGLKHTFEEAEKELLNHIDKRR